MALLLPFTDLLSRPKPAWLLEGRIPANSLVVLYGPPKVGKSFLALDWAIRLAQGGVSVLYLAGEGLGGYGARLAAWEAHYGPIAPEGFIPAFFSEKMIDLMSPNNSLEFVAAIKAEPTLRRLELAGEQDAVEVDGTVDLVIVDTLSRALVGADENDAKDMSRAVANIDLIRAKTGATVLLLHHTTKGSPNVERGSTVIRGAADVMIHAHKADGYLKATVTSSRDYESGAEWNYKLEKSLDSAVLLQDAPVPLLDLGPAQEKALALLTNAGPMRLQDIAAKLQFTPGRAHSVVTKLIQYGRVSQEARGVYAAKNPMP